MKTFFLTFCVFVACLKFCHAAYYIQASSSPSSLASKSWIQVEEYSGNSTVQMSLDSIDQSLVAMVFGGGLLLFGTGCGVGMILQQIRRFRPKF